MLTDVFFPDGLQLRVNMVEVEKDTVNIYVTSTNGKNVCPHCQSNLGRSEIPRLRRRG